MATSHQNFVFQSSNTKKLVGVKISKFGPDFLKIVELWFTYFALGVKDWKKKYKTPEICGPKFKYK